MTRIRNDSWREDIELKNHLELLVRRRYSRQEILVDVRDKFGYYSWGCVKTLGNRLKEFGISYIDYQVDISDVIDAVTEEVRVPGGAVGYRAMTKKVREVHKLNVPRDIVYDVMAHVDPDGLARRGNVGVKKGKPRNRRFVSQVKYIIFEYIGPNT